MVFFHGHWQLTGQQGKGGEDHLLFHSTTSTHSRTFTHLFATLHVRWLSQIFNRNACNYQTATRWDLPPYRFLIWLIDNVILNFVYLPVELILVFVTAIWHETPVDWNSHRLSTLYLEANRLTRCASHPKHLRHLLFSKKWLFIWLCLVCKLNPPTNPHSLTL